jgi:hypothetical protein
MNRTQIVLGLVLAAFGFESAWAVYHFGFVGLFQQIFSNFASSLVFFDLVIALSLAMVWMWRDARERGATVWPYLVATLALGSIGPLSYLIVRESAKRSEARSAAVRAPQPA